MNTNLNPPLIPRYNKVLNVLGICRISTANQDVRSLADQKAGYERFLQSHYDGEFQMTTIESQGSGEWKDRPELQIIEGHIRSREFDLIISEDLSRIMRSYEAIKLCEIAIDHEVRVIAYNDHVDTADGNWDVSAILALYGHTKNNQATSQRIKRTLRNRFTQGGVVQNPIFGYHKPAGAKNIAQVQKDPAAETIYDHWFTMLEHGHSYSAVADWLNSQQISLPETVRRSKRWTHEIVREHTMNPILKGLRVRNRTRINYKPYCSVLSY